jgi:hypothetical protein
MILAKVNVDAALSKNSVVGAIAAVAQISDGVFLGASAVVLNGHTDPEILKALACREDLNLEVDLLLRRFRVAYDCLNVIRNIEGDGKGSSRHIVMELRMHSMEFQKIEFVHEGQTANIDAHTLSRGSVTRCLGRHVWFQSPPNGVCMHYDNI